MSSDSLIDSPESPSCVICYNKLRDAPYAIIDNKDEVGKYHVQCLEQWIQKSNRGMFTQNPIESFSIFHDGMLIEIVKNNKVNVNNETILLIPEDSESGTEYSCWTNCNKGKLICTGISVVIVIVFVISPIFFNY